MTFATIDYFSTSSSNVSNLRRTSVELDLGCNEKWMIGNSYDSHNDDIQVSATGMSSGTHTYYIYHIFYFRSDVQALSLNVRENSNHVYDNLRVYYRSLFSVIIMIIQGFIIMIIERK